MRHQTASCRAHWNGMGLDWAHSVTMPSVEVEKKAKCHVKEDGGWGTVRGVI